MNISTNLSNVLDGTDAKSRYDAEVKKLLADKTILAWIMQYSIREFADYSIEEIRECIEGTPEVATRSVMPGHTPEQITGMSTEDAVPGEGKITYDIRFYAITPGGERVKLIVNVEAQKFFYPGYDIVTRAVFYCARMLSAQCGTEFVHQNYDDIKKVYSIWICMDVPQKMEYKITKYKMTKEDVYGKVPDDARYDLLEVVMVCLGREAYARQGNKLHGMLSTLLSEKLRPVEKKQILEKEYDIAASVELEGGFGNMCNLSDLIEERAMEKGIEKGIEQGREEGKKAGAISILVSLVKDNILSVTEAAARAELTVQEFEAYL